MTKQGNQYDVQFIKEIGHSKGQDKEYLSKRIFIQEKGRRCVLYHYNHAINFI